MQFKPFTQFLKAIKLKGMFTFGWTISVIYLLLFQLTGIVKCELFTAQVELESLFTVQESVVSAIERYLVQEENRLEEIRNRLKEFFIDNEQSKNIPLISESGTKAVSDYSKEAIVGNPINAFLLVKRMSTDLEEILHTVADGKNSEHLSKTIKKLRRKDLLPTNEDLNGAAVGLTRLQHTYNLNTASMALGFLQDHCCAKQLTVHDCFELGRQSYDAKDYKHAVLWMKEALKRLDDNNDELHNGTSVVSLPKTKVSRWTQQVTRTEIEGYIMWAHEIESTMGMAKKMLSDTTGIDFGSFIDELTKDIENIGIEGYADSYSVIKSKYESLCRGDGLENASADPRLKCFYVRSTNPLFRIGPAREEIVHLNPTISLFHNVLYEEEMELIKSMAKPYFDTATVLNYQTGGSEKSKVRVSKSSWLESADHPKIARVNHRIGSLTGLVMETAEELQVANYGIGGMYEPHFDFAYGDQLTNFQTSEAGNRVATFMFYMSDVLAGGATVFPTLNLAVKPVKGAAVFWYNLFEDGSGDFRTRHAACPVLMGSKWVSNKWIHERGQEFTRPCNLQRETPENTNS